MRGSLLFILSAINFSIMGTFVKYASRHMPSSAVVFWRGLLGFLLLSAFAITRKIPITGVNRKLLLLRSLAGASAMLFFFYSISRISLANATALCYSYPVFAALFSAIFLKERIRLPGILSIFFSFAGIYLIIKPEIGSLDLGELAGMASGILTGVAITTLRKLRSSGEASLTIVAYFTLFTAAFALPFSGSGMVPSSIAAVLYLSGVAVFATIAQVLMSSGYKYCTTVTGSALSLSVVLFSYIAGILFFKEVPDMNSVAGAAIIVAANIIMIKSAGSAEIA